MPGFKITSSDAAGEETSIEYQSSTSTETFWKSHMFKDAILELISMADFSKWDDNESELSSSEFIKLVVTGLAERWYNEDPEAPDSSTVKEQLLYMIDYLELDKVTLSLDDDDDDE